MKLRVAAGAFGLLMLLAPAVLSAGDEARDWLERMGAAMSQMTYQGTFVYVQGDDVETMRITHVADGDGLRERLVSISGARREVVRDSNGVLWFPGTEHGAMADPAVDRPIFFELPLDDAARAAATYDFVLGGEDRIAGHAARRLDIKPRDRYRYGYSLWLEPKSGLLLQWQLHDGENQALARLMFTDLKMGSEVDRTELSANRDFGAVPVPESGLPAEGRVSGERPYWAPASLPPGFRLASHRAPGEDAGARFEHLVYSDGIAAVSVYIEAMNDGEQRHDGVSRMGTTHAFFRSLDGMLVTVVGDVPENTVTLIGESVRAVEP